MEHFGVGFRGLALMLAWVTVPAAADTPGRHPAYLRALSDLRYARALLNRPEESRVARDQHASIENIDRAIREIKNAAWDDRKNLQDHLPVDVHWLRPKRIERAIEVLNKALHDIEREEDNPAARAWRDSAIHYLRDAVIFAQKAARDDHRF